jgi:uncharacterized protein (TIGR01244 family)
VYYNRSMLADIYNYLKLDDSLATSGQPTEAQINDIAASGYQLVINLALAGTPHALPDEAASVQTAGMEYVHIPVIWDSPTRGNLQAFFAVLDANQGRKIFVHCAANMRVSAFMALYRILRLGWPPDRAYQDLHRIWTPNETWQAFIDACLAGPG